MQALNTKTIRIALLQQLSNLCYIELLNGSKKLIKFFLFLMLEIEKQFQFLKILSIQNQISKNIYAKRQVVFLELNWVKMVRERR